VQAGKALELDFSPIDDVRASAQYRKQVASNLLKRYWIENSHTDSRTEALTQIHQLTADVTL